MYDAHYIPLGGVTLFGVCPKSDGMGWISCRNMIPTAVETSTYFSDSEHSLSKNPDLPRPLAMRGLGIERVL